MIAANFLFAVSSKFQLRPISGANASMIIINSLLAPFLILGVVILTGPICRGAHPFHVAAAEAKWNPQTERLEVSIKCHPIDLENALRLKTKEKIDLDKTENIDELLAEYVRNHFRIEEVLPGQKPSPENLNLDSPAKQSDDSLPRKTSAPETVKPVFAKFHWVGKEVELKWAWLYFEIELTQKNTELYLSNTLLMDVLEDQSNSVVIHSGTKRQSLMFNTKRRTLRFPRPEDFSALPTDPPQTK